MAREVVVGDVEGFKIRKVPSEGVEGPGVTRLIEAEFGDSTQPRNGDVASEPAREFLPEEVVAWVDCEVP